jgi:hypothetical protein
VVRQDLNPFDPQDQAPIATGGCAGEQFGSWAAHNSASTGLGNLLNQSDGKYDSHLAQVFRQWVPICVFDPSTASAPDYLVQVRTNISPTNNQALMEGAASSPNDSGGNRFAIRAAWVQTISPATVWTVFTANPNPNRSPGDPYVGGYPVVAFPGGVATRLTYIDNAGLSIAGTASMSLYANAASGTTPNYYMARVLPGSSGQTLEIRLWDIGDGCGSGCPLTFNLPASMGGGIPNCTWTEHDGSPGSGVGAAQTTLVNNASCTQTVGAGGNGSWYTIDIAVPNNYTCTPGTQTDCWFTMTYGATPPNSLADTTTWGARLLGNPVRLVQ